MIYEIFCENCGKTLEIKANTLKEAEDKSATIDCCKEKETQCKNRRRK